LTPYSKRSRWLLLETPGVLLTRLSRDGNATPELLRFFTAHIDDAVLSRWMLVYGLAQVASCESERTTLLSQYSYCLASSLQCGRWRDGQGAPQLLATLFLCSGALTSIGAALQCYPSCRGPVGMLLANLVQENASARAMLTASPEFCALRAALTAITDTLGHIRTGSVPLEISDINLRAAEGSREAEDAQGQSLDALLLSLRSFEDPAEAWARRVAAADADAAAAALLAEEEAEAAPKGRAAAAAAAAAASGKK
jgi:hypothetical protein